MTKLRGVALTLVFGGIAAALVPAFGVAGPTQVSVVGQPVAAVATTTDTKAAKPDKAQQAKETTQQRKQPTASPSRTAQGDGPNINERKKQANDELRQNKLVVGGVAVVLLLIVLWGRRVRSKRRNPGS
ncbi:hypothetical protein [Haloechinothrix halophila]|uniref:hypothetical protein n=1 Tax=Haloechinothrix halophila TaxID=1069073 RepID=UPI0012FCD851|nr:hypothetical protein [Haloechinothrix halophila]